MLKEKKTIFQNVRAKISSMSPFIYLQSERPDDEPPLCAISRKVGTLVMAGRGVMARKAGGRPAIGRPWDPSLDAEGRSVSQASSAFRVTPGP